MVSLTTLRAALPALAGHGIAPELVLCATEPDARTVADVVLKLSAAAVRQEEPLSRLVEPDFLATVLPSAIALVCPEPQLTRLIALFVMGRASLAKRPMTEAGAVVWLQGDLEPLQMMVHAHLTPTMVLELARQRA